MSASWLQSSIDLNRQLAADPEGRRATLIAIARASGRELATLQRQLAAAGHVARWIVSEGLRAEEVRASLAAIENLRRLEQVVPSQAAAMRREALLGRHTQRSLMAAIRAASRPAKQRPLSELVDTVIGICEIEGIRFEEVVPRESEALTHLGRIFDVDAEVKSGESLYGVFISPSVSIESRNVASFGDQLFKSLASLTFYENIIFGCARHEGDELVAILKETRRGVRARVKVLDIVTDVD